MKRPGLPAGWQEGLSPEKVAAVLRIEATPFSELPRTLGDHPKGYERIHLCLKHPYANSGGWQYAHRLIVMRVLGRVLSTYEHVHHVDGDHTATGNRLSNLDIMEDVDHGHYHHGLRCGCGREFRGHSFAGREIEVDASGTPEPRLRPENQERAGWRL